MPPIPSPIRGKEYKEELSTCIRLLLRVGIKVVGAWLISLGYVRGSNIYVHGYLD